MKLKQDKMNDLMFLLAYIPPHYHDFYKQLQAPSVGDEDSGDENNGSDRESDEESDSDSDSDGDDMDTD